MLHLQSKQGLMRNKIYLTIILLFVGMAAKAQNKFSGGLAATLYASQIDGDLASGYSKFGGSIQVITNLELENHTIQLRMGISERGSRRNLTTSSIQNPMHLRFRTVDISAGLLKTLKDKFEIGGAVIFARRLSATDTEGYINNLERDSRQNYWLGSVSIGYPLNEHVTVRGTGEYSITSIFNNTARSLRYKTGSYFNVLGLGIDYTF